jgi:phospholipase C
MHIGDQIEASPLHLTWKAYAESMNTACNLTASTDFVPRHVPFLYYKNVQEDSTRCTAHVVDYSKLAADLSGTLPSFVFIAPNLTDDMHGTWPLSPTISAGDTWLMKNVPTITGSAAYKQGGLLVIVWDEDDSSGGFGGTTDDPIPMFVMSPYAKTKYMSSTKADHYALLATIEDGLALTRLGSAMNATPLTDFFPAQ